MGAPVGASTRRDRVAVCRRTCLGVVMRPSNMSIWSVRLYPATGLAGMWSPAPGATLRGESAGSSARRGDVMRGEIMVILERSCLRPSYCTIATMVPQDKFAVMCRKKTKNGW